MAPPEWLARCLPKAEPPSSTAKPPPSSTAKIPPSSTAKPPPSSTAKRASASSAKGPGGKKARCDATAFGVFPSTILFNDPFDAGVGTAVGTPADWHTEAGANRAAERTLHEVRHLGLTRLTISLPTSVGARAGGAGGGGRGRGRGRGGAGRFAGKDAPASNIREFLSTLATPTRTISRTVRRNYKGVAGLETWNSVGEPGHNGTLIPVGGLAAAAAGGDVLIAEDHGAQLLSALVSAVHPVTSPWKVPLLRCVCVNNPVATQGGGGGGGGDTGEQVTLTLAIYASRLMFELIACDEIKFIMQHLTPSAPVRHPLQPQLNHPRAFHTDADAAGGADDARFCFTLPGLLAAAVSEGYPVRHIASRRPLCRDETMQASLRLSPSLFQWGFIWASRGVVETRC